MLLKVERTVTTNSTESFPESGGGRGDTFYEANTTPKLKENNTQTENHRAMGIDGKIANNWKSTMYKRNYTSG